LEIISERECEEWLARNIGENLTLRTVDAEYPHSVCYKLPIDTGAKTAIAREFSGGEYALDLVPPVLLWITCWGVFPSCENPELFYRYRRSLGENRWLIDAPGHIIGEADLKDLECLLDMSLYFYWDASLFDAAGTFVFRCSHDDWFSIRTKSEERLQEIVERLRRYKLEVFAGLR